MNEIKYDNVLNIGLISHFFKDTNLGCTALSICNVLIIDEVAKSIGKRVKYIILVNEKQPHIDLDFTDAEYEYRTYPSTKQLIKHPLKFLKTKVFDGCDLVFNICAGDGFTDIYGKWRTFSESYMVILGHWKGYKMYLAPQTIGPFNNFFCRVLAKYMMNQCDSIFVRDNMSYNQCVELDQEQKTTEVIDVALALPYEKLKHNQSYFNLGINVSGLLYNSDENKFGLSINYRELTHRMVEYALNKGYKVHLIPHVIIPNEQGEDDYHACKLVNDIFQDTIIAPMYDSPIDVKGYIAGLDMFIGARMHATIAAISSGVPVIPIAYSRKVNGLYSNLQYKYYIDAKDKNLTMEKAMLKFIQYINNINELRDALNNSKSISIEELNKYKNEIRKILELIQ